MCKWSFCTAKSNPPIAQGWGLSSPMCAVALTLLETEIEKTVKIDNNTLLEDYAKIYSVILDKPLITTCLQSLNNTISSERITSTHADVNWMRLSSILSHFEKKCHFPEDILLPMGILSEDDFYFYIRLGYVLKDYGAGVKHGEFTHRLQWFVIMYTITNNFTIGQRLGWSHTPFQLYISMGKNENKKVWWTLLDKRGEGNFGFPDTFHHWLLNNESSFGILVGHLKKRETKRRNEFVKHIFGYMAHNSSHFTIPNQFLSGNTNDPDNSHENFKAFENWFVSDLRGKLTEDQTSKIYYDLQNHDQPNYLANKIAPISPDSPPKNRTTPYIKTSRGPVYKLTSAPLISEHDADQRALASTTLLP